MSGFDMDRRAFLAHMAELGYLTAAGGVLPLLDLDEVFAAPPEPTVAVAAKSFPSALTREAVEKLGGMGRFVKPGDRVVVKPNIGWDRTPEEAANTHPDVVSELVKMAVEAGAESVRVFDRTCNDGRRAYKRSGVEEAVKGVGDDKVKINQIVESRFETVAIKRGEAIDKWPLYRPALAADVLINVPVLKHHGLTGVTIGMKNLMGVMGGNRGRLHSKMTDGLVDLNFAVKSHLTVVDATRILTANGPQGGGTNYVKRADMVCASADVVAADAWGARTFGVDPASIGHIRRAGERGLGVADLERVRII